MSPSSSGSTGSTEIIRSALFDRQYEAIKAKGKLGGAFNERVSERIDDILRVLGFPHEAFAEHRLRLESKTYDLRGIARWKETLSEFGFGPRLFYIPDEPRNRIVILEWGERRPGEPTDAYEVFGAHLKSGYFDAYFRFLGVQHAYWQIPSDPLPVRVQLLFAR